MKILLSFYLICFALSSVAQNALIRVIYDLNKPNNPPSIFPRGELPLTAEIEVSWQGSVGSDCKVIINEHSLPCDNFPEGKISITQDGKITGTIIQGIDRPVEVKMVNGSVTLKAKKIESSKLLPLLPSPTTNQAKNLRKARISIGVRSPWKDAIMLTQAIREDEGAVIQTVLCKYYGNNDCQDSTLSRYTELYKEIEKDNNIFLLQTIPKTVGNQLLNENHIAAAQAGTENAAILSPKIALDAISSFIAKRLIDELNRSYLDRFREKLNDNTPEMVDFRTMLPQTKDFMTIVGQDNTIDYKNLLTGVRQNFFEDLSNMPLNAQQLIKNHQSEIIKNNVELYIAGLAMLNATDALQQKADVAEVMDRLGKYDYGLFKNDPMSNTLTAIRLISTISNHLRITDPSGPWIDPSNAMQDPLTVYIFAGLIYKLDRNLFIDNYFKINGNWKSVHESIQEKDTQKYVEIIHQIMALIFDWAKLAQENKSDSQSVDFFLTLNERVLTTVAHCVKTEDAKDFDTVLKAVQTVIKIKTNVTNKDFVAAGTLTFSLLKSMADSSVKDSPSWQEFFRYISFAQNLIDAKTKEEVIAALEQAADPVGGYQLKRQYPFTASVTSYPGLFGGYEQYEPGINNKKGINTYGFTAPLGLAFSIAPQDKGPGIRDYKVDKAEPKASWTIFMSVLDVGAITAFRLVDQKSELPEVKWGNFIAPGLFLNYGLKNNLLTVHAGVQVGPEVQRLNNDIKPRLWRFGIGLSADLHLWSIYTKAKR